MRPYSFVGSGRTDLGSSTTQPTAARRRVLHVFGQMNTGGAETRTLEIMRHIDAGACEFHFCTLSGLPGALDDEIVRQGGSVHPIRLGPRFPVQFHTLLRTHRFSVVHAHVQLFSGLILLLAARAGVTVRIAHLHSSGDGNSDSLRRVVQRRLLRHLVDRYATDIVAVSAATMAAAWAPEWRVDTRCRVIRTAIDAARYRGSTDVARVRQEFGFSDASRIVVHVGSQQPAKNHVRLIEMFAALVRRDPGARLLLIGRRDLTIDARVRARASELGVLQHVAFAGERPDVPRLLKAATVMLFPSVREGLPGAVLEASAAGLPIVASDQPFMHEIAGACPNVRCVPLHASNEDWALAAETLERDWRARRGADPRIPPFESRFFRMDLYAREWQEIWLRPLPDRPIDTTSARTSRN